MDADQPEGDAGPVLRPVGEVQSPLRELDEAPRQGDEGAPEAWIRFYDHVEPALRDIEAGSEILLLTWLDRADRDVVTVHPRGDTTRPATGVFSTRSPHRPNPIGLHPVRVLGRDGLRLQVSGLEAVDKTPVVDVKPLLGPTDER